MDLGAVLVLFALLLVVGLYLAGPLMGRSVPGATEKTLEVSALMAERDRVITALQELDFDFKLGKVPPEDYPVQRTDLVERGAEVLRKLDAALPSVRPTASGQMDPNARIEQAAAAASPDGPASTRSLTDDHIESMLAARRAVRRAKSAGFCPRCGKPTLITDEFCSHCGKRLKQS